MRLTSLGACFALVTGLGCGSADDGMDMPEPTESSEPLAVTGQDFVAPRKPALSDPDERSRSRATIKK